jgi:hypothetical protein
MKVKMLNNVLKVPLRTGTDDATSTKLDLIKTIS